MSVNLPKFQARRQTETRHAIRKNARTNPSRPAEMIKNAATERKELAQALKAFWLQFNHPPLMCTESFEAARRSTPRNLCLRLFFDTMDPKLHIRIAEDTEEDALLVQLC